METNQDRNFNELSQDMEAQLLSYPGKDNRVVRQSIAAEYITRAQVLLGPAALVSCYIDDY